MSEDYPKLVMSSKDVSYVPNYVRLGKTPTLMGTTIPSYDHPAVDEYPQVSDSHVIDNNDFVSYTSPSDLLKRRVPTGSSASDNGMPNLGDFILMVGGKTVEFGSMAKIEERLKSIMYGEDKSFPSNQVGVDDIVVLKRVPIKIGIFLGD